MSEIMDKADVLERYARGEASVPIATFTRDVYRHLLERWDAAEARATTAERERDALLSDAVVEELALTIAGCEFWDEGSTIYPNAYRDTARAALTAAMATAHAALAANHSAPVVEG